MTITAPYPDSFSNDPSVTITDRLGQRAHRDLVAHTAHLERKLWSPRPGVWCLVGNGLSNQVFVEGPEGLIAIDTGECVEEMASALADVRKHTQAPVVAVIYTHFHYVSGTKALLQHLKSGMSPTDLPIWGHSKIVHNRLRMGAEVGSIGLLGGAHQFGGLLPANGPDAVVNVGLGLAFRNPAHAPHTPGFMPPNHVFDTPTRATIAGLAVEMTPAPSDCDDSITIWFPELKLCVNNLVWPVLFNIFPIRGEEYRDPRVLLVGIDHISSLQPDHLVATHGPPISGRERIQQDVEEYRDSIQFMWDQTVRGMTRGLTLGELCEFVKLPASYSRTYLTTQYYGVVEHHVRQIHSGLKGWFDGDEAAIFPLPPRERAQKLIAGFGGPDVVRKQAEEAVAQNDLRWALELSTWLIRADAADVRRVDAGTPDDRMRLASVLRAIAQRATAANVRNWCLTRALDLEGKIDLRRLRQGRFAEKEVATSKPEAFVVALKVLLDPAKAGDRNEQLGWHFKDGTKVGLHLRHGVTAATDGIAAVNVIELDLPTWAKIVSGKVKMSDAIGTGGAQIKGDPKQVLAFLGCFDHPTLGA